MDFDFSDEQKQFKAAVRKALEGACSLGEVRRVLEAGEAYSHNAWQAARTLGVTAASIPEQYGGLGLGYYELCVAAEELGRALAPTPVSSSIFLAAEALLEAGSETQQREWLPRLASGDAIIAFGDSRQPGCKVTGGKLNGRCAVVSDAADADAVIVTARVGAATKFVLASMDHAGISQRKLDSVDPSRALSELSFVNTPVDVLDAAVSGDAIDRVRCKAAILVAFEQLGGAERALEMACEYAQGRKAFGRKIGSYQAIKHKLADIYVKIEIARAHVLYGAWALSTDSELALAAAAARVAATDAFSHAAQENIQVHGGMGFTWEADCQLFYRRARLLALQLGNTLTWKERLVRELDARNAQPGH